MVESKVTIGVDVKIVHVNLQPFLSYHVSEDVVHEGLKGRWYITEFKEHYSWFVESEGGDEGSFPLVFLMNMDVVVTPSNVKFCEEGGIFHVVNKFRDE